MQRRTFHQEQPLLLMGRGLDGKSWGSGEPSYGSQLSLNRVRVVVPNDRVHSMLGRGI